MTIPSELLEATTPKEFLYDIAEIRRVLRSSKPFYTYILHKPNGTPFYVGKGVNDRVLGHEAEARNSSRLTHKLNVIRAIKRRGLNVGYVLDGFFDLEADALSRERHLIDIIGRHDLKRGPLTNQTDGGEGTSNPSEESRQRRAESLAGLNAENQETQIANVYFQKLMPVGSVPIKPAGKFKAEALHQNREGGTIGMTKRQAGALLASAIENRVLLEPGALLQRRLAVEGVEYVIENGVGRDMVSSGMITVQGGEKGHEILILSEEGFKYLLACFETSLLVDAGVLSPDSE